MSVSSINISKTSVELGSIPVSRTAIVTHGNGEKQFQAMAYSPMLEKEDDLDLVEKERAFAQELDHKLQQLSQDESFSQKVFQFMNFIDPVHFPITCPELGLVDSNSSLTDYDLIDLQSILTDSILSDPDLPYLAFEALRRGLLHPEHGPKQVSTILKFWSVQAFSENIIPLFEDNDSYNKHAEKLIKVTCEVSTLRVTQLPTIPFLDGKKFDIFMEKMRNLPTSEQRFLLIPDIQGSSVPNDPIEITISQDIKGIGVNVFNRVTDNEISLRIVPSLGMMQAFLDSEFGDQAVQISPIIYLSTVRQIRACGLNDTRDMMMPCPDSQGQNRCPERADGLKTPGFDFSYHDFYHAIQTSAIGKTYRRAGIVASDAVLAFAETADIDNREGLKAFGISILDLDYPLFQHFALPPQTALAQVFWLSMSDLIEGHKARIELYKYFESRGVIHPYKVSYVKDKDYIKAFREIYKTFVNEKKGPKELNEESFRSIIQNKTVHSVTRANTLILEHLKNFMNLLNLPTRDFSEKINNTSIKLLIAQNAKLRQLWEQVQKDFLDGPIFQLEQELGLIQADQQATY